MSRWIALLLTLIAMIVGGLLGLAMFGTIAAWFNGGWEYVVAIWQGAQIRSNGIFYSSLMGAVLGMSIALGWCRAKFDREIGSDFDA